MLIPITIEHGEIHAKSEVQKTDFKTLGVYEARIEDFITKNVRVLSDDDEDDETLLIVGRQVKDSTGRRNDLVALDSDGNLVLIEIKRDAADMEVRKEPMELQAVRYAATLATITTTDDLVERIFAGYIRTKESERGGLRAEEVGKNLIEEFLCKNGVKKEAFNQKQRIILVASSFDQQTLSAVAWMSANGIDISCIMLSPLRATNSTGDHLYLEVRKLVPLRTLDDFFVPLPDLDTVSGGSLRPLDTKKGRTSLPKMPTLLKEEIVNSGMTLAIKNFPDSKATVKDARNVVFNNEMMSFNDWGRRVTGWDSINIYAWAIREDGKTLSELRTELMEKVARKQEEASIS